MFYFTLVNTFCFHGLKFEVVHLVLTFTGLIHVSGEAVISINTLEKFIAWNSL